LVIVNSTEATTEQDSSLRVQPCQYLDGVAQRRACLADHCQRLDIITRLPVPCCNQAPAPARVMVRVHKPFVILHGQSLSNNPVATAPGNHWFQTSR